METPELKNIIIEIKVKKNKKMPIYDEEDEEEEIKEIEEIKKYSSKYFYELFGEKFIYFQLTRNDEYFFISSTSFIS